MLEKDNVFSSRSVWKSSTPDGVIPKARVFTSGQRDLPRIHSASDRA
jgi:hypothetical protein